MNDFILFDKKNMFDSKQSGFRSKRSSTDALSENTEGIRQGSADTFTCLMLDLRKAFDSISHQILLAKPEKHCVRQNCSKSFKSYI